MPLLKQIEAIIKYCPPTFQGGQGRNCIASLCMWWRWNPGMQRGFVPAEDAKRPDDVPATWTCWLGHDDRPDGWYEPDAEFNARRMGFCGAAVRPFED